MRINKYTFSKTTVVRVTLVLTGLPILMYDYIVLAHRANEKKLKRMRRSLSTSKSRLIVTTPGETDFPLRHNRL